jgi:uncharacterized ferritin-like protein (DUF455 family)
VQRRDDQVGLNDDERAPEYVQTDDGAPCVGSLEHWALSYIASTSLAHKLAPPALPAQFAGLTAGLRVERPGRPPELRTTWDKYKSPKSSEALRDPRKRAHLLHTFLHHELQAAELMCWALLAFPDTPEPFRRGLLGICQDEIRHMRLYEQHIQALGFHVGSFAVRDWFWERAPQASTALEFVAIMGLGFEAGNLDHTARFARMFREAGDEAGALLQELVGEEEVSHVAFGAHWFRALSGGLSFAQWKATLPRPLSPMVMRGKPLARDARNRAGMDDTFLDELEAWQPE